MRKGPLIGLSLLREPSEERQQHDEQHGRLKRSGRRDCAVNLVVLRGAREHRALSLPSGDCGGGVGDSARDGTSVHVHAVVAGHTMGARHLGRIQRRVLH
jgi:hypothetical protein